MIFAGRAGKASAAASERQELNETGEGDVVPGDRE